MGARSVVLVTLLLAAARAQAQPAPLPLLDVPFVSQSEALCGGAAAAMVLRYWGERGISAETFAPLVDRSAAGIRTTTLVAELTRRGWNATAIHGTHQIVARELAGGRPVIALIEDRHRVYHYVVIVGATDRAVIFHDPARAPLRAMARDDFDRRWRATDQWMAVIVPSARPAAADALPTVTPASPTGCDEQVRQGVAQAQADDLGAAERTLTAALACPGPAAPRELAGVRLLQRRWDDVAQLSAEAAALDPADPYAWRLLGTSRFLLDQPLAALDAWNRAGEPRLDLVRVDGLERTHQRPVERLVGVSLDEMISARRFVRAERALDELPSARSTRLELVPAPQGLAELHATIVERPLVPRDVWTYAALGVRAAIMRTAGLSLGSLTGGGESLAIEWRFWPQRPRIAATLRAPGPWSGTWGADVFGEAQAFDTAPELRRRGGRVTATRWLTDVARIELRGGAERWNTTGAVGALGASAGVLSRGERLAVRISADGWFGTARFGSLAASATASSARRTLASGGTPLGFVATGSAGSSVVTREAPLDLWPGGDVGQARATLLRAHPILLDGRIRVGRLGRTLLFGSGEAQYWWRAPGLSRIGAALFVDAARTMRRLAAAENIGDVDIGAGIRLSSLLVPGRVHLDYAHGLRDGAGVLSIRYVTAAW